VRLDKYYTTPEEDFETQTICFKRSQKHWQEVQAEFPELSVRCKLSSDNMGKTLIRLFIYCPDDITEMDTRLAIHWMKNYMGNVQRNFRNDQGTFFWKSFKEFEDEEGKYEFLLLIEKTHPLTCEIKKVTKTIEVYESICSPAEKENAGV
jgi:hypothetical protein